MASLCQLRLYICQKPGPGIRMFHKISGTVFSCHIIVPDHIFYLQSKPDTEILGQPDQRAVGLFCKFTALLFMAAFYGNRVQIPVIGGIGDLSSGNALNNGSVNPYDKMTAGIGLMTLGQTVEIALILPGGGARIAHIMDDDAIHLLQLCLRAGIRIGLDIVFFNPLGLVQLRYVYFFSKM